MDLASLFCADCVRHMPSIEFALWLAVTSGISLFSLRKGHRQFKRARLIEDMPTSKIRSASQGYTELIGVAENRGITLSSPLSGSPCVWWRYTIEKYQRSGKSSHWVTVEKHAYQQPFNLRDNTGVCEIDPEGADISCRHHHVWYGSTRRPVSLLVPPRHRNNFLGLKTSIGFSGRYRYTEYLILEGDPIYALGDFVSDRAGQRSLTPEQIQGDILRTWKGDFAALLEKFDHNNDGQLDAREWQLVREAALDEARRQQSEISGQPLQHQLAKPRHEGLPFIIGSAEQEKLSSRFRRGALLYSGGFLAAGSMASWLLGARLLG
ncbi:GIDE domain-containing protein [Porticoccus sp.]